MKQITHWVSEYQNEQEIAFIIIVGNKTDLKETIDVSKEQGEMAARDKGYQHMLCSAKTGEGVNEIFKKLAEGASTAKAMKYLGEKFKVDLPITNAVYSILYENKEPMASFLELFSRSTRKEF